MRLRIIGSFKTLKRTDMLEHIPFPKSRSGCPPTCSIAHPDDLYSTGMRRAELVASAAPAIRGLADRKTANGCTLNRTRNLKR